MRQKIKPCPFCGRNNVDIGYVGDESIGEHDAWIECLDCDARGSASYGNESKYNACKNAIKLWNKREG
ncbi:Lar family restriction alleviation protein [Xenorhabdus taiwanensis]|uniref:Restriction alleviation protein, Lar family n=1 Tax=Xenorhabdus taiwanensis TaxID=3085177 RepID=A0ABN7C2B7_9GAMM|nr:hypothetical protein TCT1_14220 [Xenorhabdus sp. TCT-1]